MHQPRRPAWGGRSRAAALAAVGCATVPALGLFAARGSPSGAGCEAAPAPRGEAARFRLVATDLDGTLLNGEGHVSAGNLEALRAVIGPACPLVLATARGIKERIPYEDLPGPLYILACGGAHGLECQAGAGSWVLHELFLSRLPEAQARAAVAAAEAEGATVWLFHVDKVFVKPGIVGAAESAEELAKFVPEPAYVHPVADLEPALAADRTLEVVAVLPNADAAAPRLGRALAAAGASAGVDVLSLAPDPIVSMKASGVDKASALRRLCEHLGVDSEGVVAFGDGGNDVPMLRFAGRGIAMANAGERARAAADVVSAWSNREDAVGRELLRLRAEGSI